MQHDVHYQIIRFSLRGYLMLCLLLSSFRISAQTAAPFDQPAFYAENLDRFPAITIPVNLVIWQKNDGSGNWQDTPADRHKLEWTIEVMNGHLKNLHEPSDPLAGVPFIPSVNIRFELKNILFYRDSLMWNDPGQLRSHFYQPHPEFRDQLNVHFVRNKKASHAGYTTTLATSDGVQDYYIVTYNSTPENTPEPGDYEWGLAKHLLHEFGHVLGLNHTYTTNNAPETCNQSDPWYLDDVFGSGEGAHCPHSYSGSLFGCDPFDPANECTNNIMGGTFKAGYLSPKQIYRMYRSLMTGKQSKYMYVSGNEFSVMPLYVSEDATWTGMIHLYNPLTVRAGVTLTIKGDLYLSAGMRIALEKGAHLVVDGGKISTFDDEPWGGISSAKKPRRNPLPPDAVLLLNNGVIEKAIDPLLR